jgi:glutathione peroxidase
VLKIHALSRTTGSSVLPLVFCSVLLAMFTPAVPGAEAGAVESFYDLKLPSLEGDAVDLSIYRGRVTLVVNVASRCGYTPQYSGLEKLHRELSGRGFSVLGFPSNDFGGQEPGTAKDIRKFCTVNYDVTFPVFSKVVTRPGADQSPAYAFLGRSGNLPAWNFGKYVVGRDGRVVAYFPSQVPPGSPELRAAVDKALAAPPP